MVELAGGDPEAVRESQRRRFADVGLVDKVVALDAEWRSSELCVAGAVTRWHCGERTQFFWLARPPSQLLLSAPSSAQLAGTWTR